MSDTATETPTPAAPAVTTPTPDTTAAAGAGELAKLTAQLASLAAERDQLAERAKLADTLAAEREKLSGELAAIQADRDKALAQVDTMTKAQREASLTDKLRAAMPHAAPTDVKRLVASLAPEQRHSDNAEKTAAEILGTLKAENSALLRAPVGASGGTNPIQTSPQVDTLAAFYGPRRRK